MDQIILEVGDETAKAWSNTPAKLRAQITKNIEIILSDLLSKANDANFELLLREVRYETASNGLTKEILETLLASD